MMTGEQVLELEATLRKSLSLSVRGTIAALERAVARNMDELDERDEIEDGRHEALVILHAYVLAAQAMLEDFK